MALMWIQLQAAPWGLLAGFMRTEADCHLSKRSCGRFVPPEMTREDMEPRSQVKGAHSRRAILASLAALGTTVLASSCCLPLFPFLAAAGTAGSSAFFVKLRPFLVVAAIGFVAFGFYQGWHAKKCGRERGTAGKILPWFSAAIVLVFTLFPQALANFLADVLAR